MIISPSYRYTGIRTSLTTECLAIHGWSLKFKPGLAGDKIYIKMNLFIRYTHFNVYLCWNYCEKAISFKVRYKSKRENHEQ
jgi:hypothetical protein